MTIYSIEKVGSDYVVKADDQGLLKFGSRRRAAQLVLEASGLLDEAGGDGAFAPDRAPSIARDGGDGA